MDEHLVSMETQARHPLVGKKVHYRKLYDQHRKAALVVSARKFKNWHGAIRTLLIMDNGDEIVSTACYVERRPEP
ncbi:MAG: hypothetical protein KAT62_00585 [Desulfuromonadales bacterium]|nr:hypothetical protein [Desulfuromonadales bacterium]